MHSMFRKPIRETVAAFPAHESQLAGLRKTVEEICRQANLSAREINNIILAIEEGATNIIRHAYLLSEGEVRLKVAVYRHFIIFSLFDQGKSFQPPDRAKLDLKKMTETGRKGGLGFYLINKVMDRVEYFSLEGENELRLTKFISDKGERDLEWSGGLSLRMKFSAGTLLIILILLAGAYYYINSRSTRYIYSQVDKTVDALCNTIASQAYGYIINHRSDAEFDELVVSYQRANDILSSIVITGANGEILADSRGPGRLHSFYDPKRFALYNGAGQAARFDVTTPAPVMIRRIDHGGSNQGMVVMQYSTVTVAEQLTDARRIILIITVVGLLIGIAGIYLLSNYFVRPIGRIVSRVRKFSQGDLDSQLPLVGAEEFYEISKALNELIMRIRRDRKNIVEREILHKEMQLAEEIQRALIPRQLPTIHGFDVGTIYKAARMVGGDLFDFVKIDDQTFGAVVADVSGKGVPGSLVMAMVRTALRLEAKGNRSSRDILLRLNDYVVDDIKRGMFVTILLAVIDTRSRRVNFASAGHNPIIHYSHCTHEALFLNAKGMPVGVKTDRMEFASGLEEAIIELEPDDFLVIYTDGVTEGRGGEYRAYGTDRVIDIIRENENGSAGDAASAIEDDIVRFIGKHDQHDDITMVILKNCPASQENVSEPPSAAVDEAGRRIEIDSIIVDPPRDREPEI
jgi:serine phosphatase RsbU (regulator of sigma subunit)/anti-sigma regulatory factor (Ser/Thr protein kinase)